MTSQPCFQNSDCFSNLCNGANGLCIPATKQCSGWPNNPCNLNGDCVILDNFGVVIESCPFHSSNCRAMCVCRPGYYGMDCSKDKVAYVSGLSLRQSLCQQLDTTSNQQSDDLQTLLSLLSTVSSIVSDISLVSNETVALCSRVLTTRLKLHYNLFQDDLSLTIAINTLSKLLNSVIYSLKIPYDEVLDSIILLSRGRALIHSIYENPISIISDNIRLLSAKVSSNTFEYRIPVTSLESNFDIQEASVSTHFPLEYYKNSSGFKLLKNMNWNQTTVGVTLIQFVNNPRRRTTDATSVIQYLNFYNSSMISSNYIVDVVLENEKKIQYFNVPDISGVVYCVQTNVPYNITVHCDNGADFSANVSCSGMRGYYNYSCPSAKKFPICSPYAGFETCKFTSYSPFRTSCQCTPPSANNNAVLLTEYSAKYTIKMASFNYIFIDQTIPLVHYSSRIVSSVMFVYMFVIFALAGGYLFDKKRFKKLSLLKISEHTRSKYTVRVAKQVSVREFFDGVLPKEFCNDSFYESYLRVLDRGHDLFYIFLSKTHFREEKDLDMTFFRFFRIACRIVTMMFWSTVVVKLVFADDGTCQSYTNPSSCALLKTLDGKRSICEWNEALEFCFFASSSYNPSNLVLLTTAICVGTSLVCSFLNIYIFKIEKCLMDKRHKDLNFAPKPKSLKRKPGFVIEEHDLDVLDEFRGWQTIKGIFFLGAVFQKMRERLDFKTSQKEVVGLLSEDSDLFLYSNSLSRFLKSNNMLPIMRILDTCFLSSVDCFGDPYTAAYLLHSVKYGYSPKRLVIDAIQRSRKEAQILRKVLERQRDSESMIGTIIMSRFLIDSFYGYKRFILNYYFDIRDRNLVFDPQNDFFKMENIGCLAIVFSILCAMTAIIVNFSYVIGAMSDSFWSIGILLSFYIDQCIICPVYCGLIGVAIPSIMKDEVQTLFSAIRYQAKSIIQRTRGSFRHGSGLKHSFNPACRLARSFPLNPIARLVISMADVDFVSRQLRHSKLTNLFDKVVIAMSSIFSILYSIIVNIVPKVFHDLTIETLVSIVICTILFHISYVIEEYVYVIAIGFPCSGLLFLMYDKCVYEYNSFRPHDYFDTDEKVFAEFDGTLSDDEDDEENQIWKNNSESKIKPTVNSRKTATVNHSIIASIDMEGSNIHAELFAENTNVYPIYHEFKPRKLAIDHFQDPMEISSDYSDLSLQEFNFASDKISPIADDDTDALLDSFPDLSRTEKRPQNYQISKINHRSDGSHRNHSHHSRRHHQNSHSHNHRRHGYRSSHSRHRSDRRGHSRTDSNTEYDDNFMKEEGETKEDSDVDFRSDANESQAGERRVGGNRHERHHHRHHRHRRHHRQRNRHHSTDGPGRNRLESFPNFTERLTISTDLGASSSNNRTDK